MNANSIAPLIIGLIVGLLTLPGIATATPEHASTTSSVTSTAATGTPVPIAAPPPEVALDLKNGSATVSGSLVYDGFENTTDRAFPTLLTGASKSQFWLLNQSVMEMAPVLRAGSDTGTLLFPAVGGENPTVQMVGAEGPRLSGDGLEGYLMLSPVRVGNWSTPYYATDPTNANGTFLNCQGSVLFPYSTTPYIAVQWEPAWSIAPCGVHPGRSDFNLYLVNPQPNGTVNRSDIQALGRVGMSSEVPIAANDLLDFTVSFNLTTGILAADLTDEQDPSVSYTLNERLATFGFTPVYAPNATYYFGAGASGDDLAGWGLVYLALGSAGEHRIVFHETGLPSGMKWAVRLGDYVQYARTATMYFLEPLGTYAYTIPALAGFTSVGGGNLSEVGQFQTIPVAYTPLLVGVATNVTIASFDLQSSGTCEPANLAFTQCFSIEQDVFVHAPKAFYWVENQVLVGRTASGAVFAAPAFAVWNLASTTPQLLACRGIGTGGSCPLAASTFHPVTLPFPVNLTARLVGHGVKLENFRAVFWYAPTAPGTLLGPGDAIYLPTTATGHERLQLLVVGEVMGALGPDRAVFATAAARPTSGSVSTYLWMGTTWTATLLEAAVPGGTVVAPSSSMNLAWTTPTANTADFSDVAGASTQGMSYQP
jgi:hypothetical protein